MELQAGHVAVVTGGASGIGLALAERFARAGMSLVLADVEEAALAAAEQTVKAHGVDVLTVRTDVS
jgi:NAD(P)-dependent dehydrogenase (short-subunit alcohol dehydrogenase family)